ncbi:MAG: hypothetical protein AAFQ41_06100 [Cyanobacteria bacterium J06623_7]
MQYKSLIYGGLLLVLTACGQKTDSVSQQVNTSEPTVIELTQVGCQFLETEAQNYQYQTQNAADCEEINAETLSKRQADFKPLELKPGKYIFRVTNSNVPYPLGFYLRGQGIKQVSLPKVSGGGLTQGTTKDYEVDLVAGEYVFSCPLNPTPDYPIVVN